jgi:hypothetical protein
MKKKLCLALASLALFFAAGMQIAGSAETSGKFDVKAAIAAGDHQGLANYYKAQAESFRQEAAMHENMKMEYGRTSAHYKGQENTFSTHCAALKDDAEKMAAKYDEMAKEEEKLATPKKSK